MRRIAETSVSKGGIETRTLRIRRRSGDSYTYKFFASSYVCYVHTHETKKTIFI
jgi:hypothetical protein